MSKSGLYSIYFTKSDLIEYDDDDSLFYFTKCPACGKSLPVDYTMMDADCIEYTRKIQQRLRQNLNMLDKDRKIDKTRIVDRAIIGTTTGEFDGLPVYLNW